ncbi:DUF362 domain-containing protein [Feifania hominis]|uniref:Ferredoxin n=1 Tax=Feifania hominis TaxID=2763660 RepID=A0A926DCG5_9FIRM|nr:DUF362 domain-containing protein [Feifania hominis]MBC8535302.1 DUF362 domain-containing protein [Feifania hominis]
MYSTTVSVARAQEYDAALLRENIALHFEHLGGVSRFVKPGTRVLLKVNLLMARKPDAATTTHPALVEALAKTLVEAGAAVTIADSPGGLYTEAALRKIYRVTGMEQAAANAGARLNFDTGADFKRHEEGKLCRNFHFIQPYFDADLVISVCKLKTHAMTTYTGAVKNMFGLVPGLEKPEFHFRFPERKNYCDMLVDLCDAARPALAFMDAVVAMEGDGPSGGTPRGVGLTLASESPFALDLAAAAVVGLGPDQVPTLERAAQRGFAPADAGELTILGEPISSVRVEGFQLPKSHDDITRFGRLPKFLNEPLRRYGAPRPVISRAVCIGCGACAESCPAKTIAIREKKAFINYKNCIRCFCCQEMCPVRAIAIKKRKLFAL